MVKLKKNLDTEIWMCENGNHSDSINFATISWFTILVAIYEYISTVKKWQPLSGNFRCAVEYTRIQITHRYSNNTLEEKP